MVERFRLKVLTPMFMGGADPRGEPELRAASIRGTMRFWFRAIAGAVTSDPREVYRLESEVFGNTEQKSKVVVRVVEILDKEKQEKLIMKRQSPLEEEGLIPIPRNLGSLVYLANMGLVKYYSRRQLEKANSQNSHGFYWDRGAFLPEYEFLVEIMVTSATVKELITNVLKITVYLGGFGARWRHGFGSCEIIDEQSGVPIAIDIDKTVKESRELITKLAKFLDIKVPGKIETLPEFPTFKHPYVEIWEGYKHEKNVNGWKDMLAYLGKKYREFRLRGGDKNSDYGHSWDFKNIVDLLMNESTPQQNFAINSIFGIPIQYQRRRNRKKAILEVKAKREEIGRRASPLIFHIEPEKQLIRATLFKSMFIPPDANLSIKGFKLRTPSESDFRRIELFLKSLGLKRRYPNA